MVAIFITIVSLIAMLYFVQLGARRGVFPVLLTLLVTLLAFLFAMNYRIDVALLLHDWLPKWRADNLRALGYLAVFAAAFFFFGYLAVRFTPEIAPLYKKLDRVLGTLVGILAGIALTGSLCMAWFTSTLAARYQIPEGRIYFKPHDYLLLAYGRITGARDPTGGLNHFARFPGGAWFDADSAIAGIKEKGSRMPRHGDGFWIASVPPGLRVFISSVRAEPLSEFKKNLEGWITRGWEAGPIQGGRARRGYMGDTPCYIECEDPEAWIAVETELSKRTPIPKPGENPLADDGQVDTLSGPNRRFLKIYRLRKQRETRDQPVVAKLIALMHRRGATLGEIKDLLPASQQYTIRPEERAHALSELMADGVAETVANELIDVALRGGKVLYETSDGKVKAFEITSADGDYAITLISGY